MMISPEYCRMMAAYNAWQNTGLRQIVEGMSRAEVERDRGAFFGSIRETLNHLWWGDQLWIGRFDGGPGPSVPPEQHTEMTPTIAIWAGDRVRTDARISHWADKVQALDLTGEFSYQSVMKGEEVRLPMGQAVAHFFNHQTHHRGQVHAMLTAAGAAPGVTDLCFMP